MEKTIYDLKLHESLQIREGLYVFRVPGGWIYKSYYSPPLFVPYSDEFNEKAVQELWEDSGCQCGELDDNNNTYSHRCSFLHCNNCWSDQYENAAPLYKEEQDKVNIAVDLLKKEFFLD